MKVVFDGKLLGKLADGQKRPFYSRDVQTLADRKAVVELIIGIVKWQCQA